MRREEVELSASQDLIEFLNKIDHVISKYMKEAIIYNQRCIISHLSFGSSNDTISFIYSNKLNELIEKYGDRYNEYAWSIKRAEMKVGKVIRLITKNTFPVNHPKDKVRLDVPNDIESFVNMFKCEKDKHINYQRFELVKGEDIRYWYDEENYSDYRKENDALSRSCMRYEKSGKYLQMYVDNPDRVNMLILKDDKGMLRGRALIWNLTNMDRTYMDRIYTINDYDIELYKQYAKDNGWLYKLNQTYGYDNNIIDGSTNDEYMYDKFIMKCIMPNKNWEYYSYLDTLCVYNPDTGELSNEGKLLINPPHLRLQDYQGSFFDDAEHRELVYSEHHDEDIAREDSRYCNFTNDWYYKYETVYVYNTGGKYAYKNYNGIVISDISDTIKYFLEIDCEYSNYLDTYIYKNSIQIAYEYNEHNKSEIMIHKKMLSQCKKDKKGNYVYIENIKPKDGRFKEHSETNEEDFIDEIVENNIGMYPNIWGDVPMPSINRDRLVEGIDRSEVTSERDVINRRYITRRSDILNDENLNEVSEIIEDASVIAGGETIKYGSTNSVRLNYYPQGQITNHQQSLFNTEISNGIISPTSENESIIPSDYEDTSGSIGLGCYTVNTEQIRDFTIDNPSYVNHYTLHYIDNMNYFSGIHVNIEDRNTTNDNITESDS